MLAALFIATAALYALACAGFVLLLVRGGEKASKWALPTLGLAAASHVAFLVADYAQAGRIPVGTIQQTLAVSALLLVVVFLVSGRKSRLTMLGAFITPITLLFFLTAGLQQTLGTVPSPVRSALLPVHVGVNVLGIVAFALAFAAAVAYVIQEHLLRHKRLGGLFHRLPALDVLDSLGLRLVSVGFPLLTIGIVTGAVWAAQLGTTAVLLSAARGFAVLAWVVFAAVLMLRVVAGWRGRRAAIGTIMGFVCALMVLAGYVMSSARSAM